MGRRTGIRSWGLVIASIVLAGCGPSLYEIGLPALPAAVEVRNVERSYAVHGMTRTEIDRSLTAQRVHNVDGRFNGLHSWDLRWQFRFEYRLGQCRMTTVRVRLFSEVTLPEWVDKDRADPGLVQDWERFLQNLRAHEHRHRAIAYEAAREVYRRLSELTATTCHSMEVTANRLAHRVLDRYRDRSRIYDRETRHGATEGVRWPLEQGV